MTVFAKRLHQEQFPLKQSTSMRAQTLAEPPSCRCWWPCQLQAKHQRRHPATSWRLEESSGTPVTQTPYSSMPTWATITRSSAVRICWTPLLNGTYAAVQWCSLYTVSTQKKTHCYTDMHCVDKPQRPQQLQVHIQAASTCKLFFNVTWTPPYTPPGVNVFYTVAVVNWSDVDSSKNITLMRSISSCFVAFPHPANPTSCYPYQFTVLAENAAGVSGYSNPVVANVAIG